MIGITSHLQVKKKKRQFSPIRMKTGFVFLQIVLCAKMPHRVYKQNTYQACLWHTARPKWLLTGATSTLPIPCHCPVPMVLLFSLLTWRLRAQGSGKGQPIAFKFPCYSPNHDPSLGPSQSQSQLPKDTSFIQLGPFQYSQLTVPLGKFSINHALLGVTREGSNSCELCTRSPKLYAFV